MITSELVGTYLVINIRRLPHIIDEPAPPTRKKLDRGRSRPLENDPIAKAAVACRRQCSTG
jgi:hypothetical protein